MASLFHDGCECYFQHELDPEVRFCARRGVHEVWCPCYRRSLDPVDYMADEEFKAGCSVFREFMAREKRGLRTTRLTMVVVPDKAIDDWMSGHASARV